MLEKLTQPIEIAIIKLTIYILKLRVGEPCKEEDENVLLECGCFTCKTYRVIEFLKEWIELCKL
jgi:hypothetical protein